MLSIKIICVGKLKERFFLEAAAEYQKRLGSLCRLEIEELPEARLSAEPTEAEVDAALHREAESIFLRIPSGAVVAALCIEGKTIDSVGFSQFLEMCALKGKSRLCFIIGGSMGLHREVKERADLQLSFSPMTFPHHLVRIMLLEQLYRAFQIQMGSKYHK
jgi:23S rRNA (pseudouridine1915-N3)-methyltransferase